ncbi:hypothetical protein [Rodentibacter haemolyticus]|uniref:Uncharacterized protein n=1 Tax=Rodentibacter haemolyticus TaxID=2778911 RepID=A0ABX6UYX3_9PAST|nr:hypothetical protein [Rodentibacter haemolyticus]QPB42674.1 hypothetical protein IHV77_00665 [Rodentibacter haemolyticus]
MSDVQKPIPETLTIQEMMDFYPLLTVIFDTASDVLMNTAMDSDSKQQLRLEIDTFYRSIMNTAPDFSPNYNELSEDEQEAECKVIGSFVYFASLMGMFSRKIETTGKQSNDNGNLH